MQNTQTLPASLTNVRARRTDASPAVRSNVLVGILLIGVMLIGAYFRYTGLNWDDFTHLHPDERFQTDVAQGLGRSLNPSGDEGFVEAQIAQCLNRYPDTGGKGGYFDALCSPLNPLNANSQHGLYVYGTLPLFMARGSADLYGEYLSWYARTFMNQPNYDGSFWATYDGVQLVWRIMSATAEMFVILFVFVIGLRLHGKWVGLLAAILYAGTVFSIQNAHFGTPDPIANFFAAMTILSAVQIQRGGKIGYYLLFGFAFGCSIASRINLLPLFGLVIVAAAMRVYPSFARGTPMNERNRSITQHSIGLVAAAALALLCFRVFNPYAFDGPGFFGVIDLQGGFPFIAFHDRWLNNMAQAQAIISPGADSPPNYQWLGRTPYLYPLGNMVLWGMGAPFGIVAWVAAIWALWRILRGKPGAMANLILIVWIAGYFGYMGRQWVTTMRYFLPLYPVLAVLAAWGLIGAWQWASGRINLTPQPPLHKRGGVLRVITTILLVGVPLFTLLWAAMFTNIYRNLLTRVAASHWVIEQVPGDFAMTVEGAPEGTPLININVAHRDSDDPLETRVSRIDTFTPRVAVQFTPKVSGTITSIHAPHIGDPNDDPEPEHLRFTVQRVSDMAIIAQADVNQDFPRDKHIIGDTYDFQFPDPFSVEEGETYEFVIQLIEGDAVISGGSIVTWEGAWDDPVPTGVCAFPNGITMADDPPSGLIWDARDCQRLSPWYAQVNGYKPNLVYEDEPTKRVTLLNALEYSDYMVISSNRFYDQMARNPTRWPMTNLYYDTLFAGELGYHLEAMFQETFELGPLRVSDSYLPIYDAPEWLQEFEAEEAFTVYDHPVVFIYQKNPDYDHEKVVELFYSVPLTRVYDAPVFRNCEGTDKYYCDPTLVNVFPLSSEQAAQSPTRLLLSDETKEIQYDGGTWSERFDSSSVINLQPVVTVASWWLVILLVGWVTFPALFTLAPGLSLRGYPFAKFAGLFVIGWVLWVLASQRIEVWSQTGVAGGLVVMALISAALVWRKRDEFGAYVRENWRKLALVEGITLIAFLAFLAVRLTNPDLWHPSFGGEKPMDFAYFNGVLRSTIFPPYDPWYSTGFLNYYYFGYVIVGSPVLLLKMVPSIAYNLILPTLFALTAVSAYGVAYDLVSALRRHSDKWKVIASPTLAGVAALIAAVVLGNLDTPRVYLTGVARTGGYSQPSNMQDYLVDQYVSEHAAEPDDAAMLDIISRSANPTFGDKLSYEVNNSTRIVTSLFNGFTAMTQGSPLAVGAERWFWGPSRVLAETPGVEGGAITEMPIFTFIYGDLHAHMIAMPMQLMLVGLFFNEILIAGNKYRRRDENDASLPERSLFSSAIAVIFLGVTVGMLRATNTWDWITYLVLGGVVMVIAWWLAQGARVRSEIAESSMMRVPMVMRMVVLGAVGLVLGMIAGIGAGMERPILAALGGLGFGLIAGIFAVGFYADERLIRRFTRRSGLAFIGTVGGLFIASFIGSLPYTTYYTAIYNSIRVWEDGKTPIWAYFDIHGLFLFMIFSLLLWETSRWLRSTFVRDLRGRMVWIALAALFVLVVLLGVVWMTLTEWQVTLIAVPLLLWTGALYFRPGQSRPMQFTLLMIGLALGLTLGVEFIVLDGDIGRQNTVFKFYIQAWLLFSVAGGAIFAWMVASMRKWTGSVRGLWVVVVSVLVVVAGLFPVMAARGKAVFRFDTEQPFTLDGAEFMNYANQYEGDPAILAEYPDRAPFPLNEDYAMIRWLQENVLGSPTIIEGLSNDTQYKWNGRISIYTGLPAVLGWNFHQRQQRTLEPMGRLVEMRNANINAFYELPSIGTAWEMIDFYNVEYIIVGRLEQSYYSDDGLAKFQQMASLGLLEVAYTQGSSTIYHVVPGAELSEFG